MLSKKLKSPINKSQSLSPQVHESKLSQSARDYLSYELTHLTLSKVQHSFDRLTENMFQSDRTPPAKTSIWNLVINSDVLTTVLRESLEPFINELEKQRVSAKIGALILRCKRVKFKLYVIHEFIRYDIRLPMGALNRQYLTICDEVKSQKVYIDFKNIPKPEIEPYITVDTTLKLITRHLITFESRLKDFLPGLCEVIGIPLIVPNLPLPVNIRDCLLNIAPVSLKGTQPDLYLLFRLILLRRPPNFNDLQLKQWESYYAEFCAIASFWFLNNKFLDFEKILPKDYRIKTSWEEFYKMSAVSDVLFGQIINTFTKLSPYFWYLSLNLYVNKNPQTIPEH